MRKKYSKFISEWVSRSFVLEKIIYLSEIALAVQQARRFSSSECCQLTECCQLESRNQNCDAMKASPCTNHTGVAAADKRSVLEPQTVCKDAIVPMQLAKKNMHHRSKQSTTASGKAQFKCIVISGQWHRKQGGGSCPPPKIFFWIL